MAETGLEEAPRQRAVFYDLDGTLVRGSVIPYYLHYARTLPSFTEAWVRHWQMALAAPSLALSNLVSRADFQSRFYRHFRGISRDRLETLSGRIFNELTRERVLHQARALVRGYAEQGYTQYIVSGALEYVARPVADYLGIGRVLCNRLVFDQGVATGALETPVMGDAGKLAVLLDIAQRHRIDLTKSHAYGDSIADIPMLAAVGQPVVVNPDWRMRVTARSNRWSVVSFS